MGDPATWGGQVPGPSDVAVIDRDVLLDVDATVAGVQIAGGASLQYDPRPAAIWPRPATWWSRDGWCCARSTGVVHRLEFVDVDEDRFEGGHSDMPMDTDVGLWVVEGGLLDAAGAEKTAWTHLAEAALAGDTTVVDDATGWEVGDEVVITPTEPVTVDEHWLHHDRRTITGIDGTRVTLGGELEHPHEPVEVRDGVVHRAEVLN